MKNFFSHKNHALENLPHGKLILDTRRAKRTAIVSTAATIVSIIALYLMMVHPIFLPHDISNPVVHKFMLSQEFKKNATPFFLTLTQYNQSTNKKEQRTPHTFFATDHTFGLIVTLAYEPIPMRMASNVNNINQQDIYYRYDPAINIRLDPRILILFSGGVIFSLFTLFFLLMHFKKTQAEVKAEDRILDDYFGNTESSNPLDIPSMVLIKNIFKNFHKICIQFGYHRAGKRKLVVKDEYDVQYILHAMLQLHFDDIELEEYTPSYAGTSSKIDFLLKKEEIAIETKKTRKGLDNKKLADQLIIDIARYKTHAQCKKLICFIYDPEGRIRNPRGFEEDLSDKTGQLKVMVAIHPQ